MKGRIFILILGAFSLLPSCTCQRSRGEFWEDTKTCGRYVGKGLRSLAGRHSDGRPNFYESWDRNDEFVALRDAPEAAELALDGSYPPPRESPGDPGSAVPGIDGFSNPQGMLAQLFNNIHFETDNYSVTGMENLQTLKEIADFLSVHRGTYVFIEGHADERGAAAYNLALGAKRANSVRGFLIQNGVSPDQLFTISFGKERPLVQGHDEGSWRENRRAQFKLYER